MNINLITFTPSPESVCDLGARVCVSEDIPQPDEGLRALGHALESGHESVLEHAVFTFAIEGISRACSHQLVRHRMASFSQQSQRYVNVSKEQYFSWVMPKTIATNASVETHDWFICLMDEIDRLYRWLVKEGIPEEDARYILPNACTTNLLVTMNARELRHFFSLRCCERAQWEIKELAERMLALVREVAPTLFKDAGPRCKALGYCPEAKGCGKMPKGVA
jgi:thymidylate synthase (FAD)